MLACYGTLIYIETAALSAPRETPHHLERNKEMNCAKTAVEKETRAKKKICSSSLLPQPKLSLLLDARSARAQISMKQL